MYKTNKMGKKSLLIMLLFLSSCSQNGGVPVQEQNMIEIGLSSVTSFTVNISGIYNGISKTDIALGKHGVMFCEKSDDAEGIFRSWKDGNDKPECFILDKGTFAGESFTCTIDNLNPNTEYNYCLFLQNRDNSVREISAVSSFRTNSFNPEFKNIQIEDIHFIDATASLSILIDKKDATRCTWGIVISETPYDSLGSLGRIIEYKGDYEETISIQISELKPDKYYYCIPFVSYTKDNDVIYVYGEEHGFNTKLSEQMYVDLDLPSGIKWANCDLCDNGFVVYPESSFYQWGCTVPLEIPSNAAFGWAKSQYKYWDTNSDSYINIGANISDTEYDAAKILLGGKWRMPTKEDVEELISSCDISNFEYVPYSYMIGSSYFSETCAVGSITGRNGNTIKICVRGNSRYWCGTASDTDSAYFFRYAMDYNSYDVAIPGTGRIELYSSIRHAANHIRPVWDPSLAD